MDIVALVAQACARSKEYRDFGSIEKIFKHVAKVDLNLENHYPMFQMYRQTGQIPPAILKFCRRLAICTKCGASLSGRTSKISGQKSGVDVRECYPDCPTDKGKEEAGMKKELD